MEQEEASSKVGRALAQAYLVLGLVYMMWVLWQILLPEHRRQQMKLQLIRSSARVTNRLARRAGAASLSREALTGHADYELPLQLSLLRDRLEAAYNRARATIV